LERIPSLAEVTVPNVGAFIAELQGRTERHANNRFVTNKAKPLSSSYVQGFARSLRAFRSWLYEDGYSDTNVLKVLKLPKVMQKVIEVLIDSQIGTLLGSFDRNEPYDARNHANVIALLDCGLRASEICELTLPNARFDEGFLKMRARAIRSAWYQ
jgi:site-specific recombinase XerD